MNIVHTTSLYDPTDGSTRRRMAVARTTWESAYRQYPEVFVAGHMPIERAVRTSRILGDVRSLPFIKDVVSFGLVLGNAGPQDAIMLTNADTCLIPSLMPLVFESLQRRGIYYSLRVDHARFDSSLPDQIARRGEFYPGADLFAFTSAWWETARDDYPDMLLGAEAWDGLLKAKMQLSGCVEGPPVVYHEAHPAFWMEHLMSNPAQIHNRALAARWIAKHGVADFLYRPVPGFGSSQLVCASTAILNHRSPSDH